MLAAALDSQVSSLESVIGPHLSASVGENMNHSAKAYAVLTCLISAMTTPALAQQPPDPVQSDSMANTAMGTDALLNVNLSESGCHDTASGEDALYSDTSGSYNTATGFGSLFSNISGNNNTAGGSESLYSNLTGSNNNADGYQSMYNNTSGSNNIATGYQALYSNTTGGYNSALGYLALNNSQSGLGNIGVGPFAGQNIVQGKFNIDIGSWGSADESNTIRIGLPKYHQATYIAGITNSQVTGAQVYVTANGQLGVLASSERYKADITTLAPASERLAQLRPVSFHLKTDPNGAIQYGLIAEEVDKVYPELVIRDRDGKIQGVRYDELAPILLNEIQRQQASMLSLTEQNHSQASELFELKQQVTKLADLEREVAEMHAALAVLQTKDQLVAQR
jgi:hypothetical protein